MLPKLCFNLLFKGRVSTVQRVYPEWVGFYPLPKCRIRRANPQVQDLCKHPSFPQTSHKHQLKGPHKFVDWESIPPTQGATQVVDWVVWTRGEAKGAVGPDRLFSAPQTCRVRCSPEALKYSHAKGM